ncbi:hypothetical protein P3T76_012344 [Phytophthora citrophthora]|uniref:Uncharacterized protein n=1 Tax=Phytophthora citrophthora TaxID=4793 RepID=A0AAD9G5S4_9STRA|nr:hypothetical protein P3T76_012344 [Phytophthora citrophthora]
MPQRDDWIDVLCMTTSVNPHPLKVLGCPQARIHKTLSEYVSLRRCLLPVVHDVMLRMVFGDLILGSRLYFLKTLNPTVQQCIGGYYYSRNQAILSWNGDRGTRLSSFFGEFILQLFFTQRGDSEMIYTFVKRELRDQAHKRHCQFIYSHAEKIGVDEAVVVEVLRQLGFEPPTAEVLPPPEHRIWIPRTLVLLSTSVRVFSAEQSTCPVKDYTFV